MPHRLPPLTALRAFDAAARHMSFSKAAAELFVTPAALSYQIKQLEEHLGTPVFHRLNRAVELTEAGRALQPGVASAFDNLQQAVRAVGQVGNTSGFNVTAGPAFTAKWFAPRLFRFAEAHPEIDLRFVATLRIMDFQRDGVDAAIRFGTADDPDYYNEVLADEWITPVCTPAVAAQIERDGGLHTTTLLHDESIEMLDPAPTWAAWARVSGMELDTDHGARFTNADHSIDVALEGGGIALGRVVLIERYLETGRLVKLFDLAMRPHAQYRFVCPVGDETNPRVSAFLAWLREEISGIDEHAIGMKFVDV